MISLFEKHQVVQLKDEYARQINGFRPFYIVEEIYTNEQILSVRRKNLVTMFPFYMVEYYDKSKEELVILKYKQSFRTKRKKDLVEQLLHQYGEIRVPAYRAQDIHICTSAMARIPRGFIFEGEDLSNKDVAIPFHLITESKFESSDDAFLNSL